MTDICTEQRGRGVGGRCPALLACALSLLLGGLGGCAFVRGSLGDAFEEEAIHSIQKGITTREEVTSRLGAPDRIVEANGHEILHYYRYDLKSGTILFFSRTNIKSDDLYILLNRDGVVHDVVFGKRTDRLSFQVWPFGD